MARPAEFDANIDNNAAQDQGAQDVQDLLNFDFLTSGDEGQDQPETNAESKPGTTPDGQQQKEPEPAAEPKKRRIAKYLDQEIDLDTVPDDQLITNFQKGMNYDKVSAKAAKYEQIIQKVSKLLGYSSVEEYEKAVLEWEKEQEKEQFAKAGTDPNALKEIIENLPEIQEVRRLKREAEIKRQKEALKDQRFFRELEPQIDALVAQNPYLSVEVAFKYLRGQKLDELLAKATEDVKKSTIADLQDKAKRGIPSAEDGSNAKPEKQESNFAKTLDRVFANYYKRRKE